MFSEFEKADWRGGIKLIGGLIVCHHAELTTLFKAWLKVES